MKFLNKNIYVILIILFSIFVYSNSYTSIINTYIERNDFENARRYMLILKNSRELSVEEVLLELKINSNFMSDEDFLEFMRNKFEKYGFKEILQEIIKFQSPKYFNFNDLKILCENSIINFPEDFSFLFFRNINFYSEKGLDIMQANQYRKELKTYLSYKKDDFTNQAEENLIYLTAFEFGKKNESLEKLFKSEIEFKTELQWFFKFILRKEDAEKVSFRDDFFLVLKYLTEHWLEGKDNLAEFEKLELSEKSNFYRNFALANIYEKLKNRDKSMYFFVAALDSYDESIDKKAFDKITQSVNRLSNIKDEIYWESLINNMLSRNEFDKAYSFTNYLSKEKKIFTQSKILFYYYGNHESALEVINSSKLDTVDINYIKAEILLKSFRYEEALDIFNKIALQSESAYFESSLYKIAEILIQTEQLTELQNFSLKLFQEYGDTHFTGQLFLKISEVFIQKEMFDEAEHILRYVLFNFSADSDIFNQTMDQVEKLKIGDDLKELQNNINTLTNEYRNFDKPKSVNDSRIRVPSEHSENVEKISTEEVSIIDTEEVVLKDELIDDNQGDYVEEVSGEGSQRRRRRLSDILEMADETRKSKALEGSVLNKQFFVTGEKTEEKIKLENKISELAKTQLELMLINNKPVDVLAHSEKLFKDAESLNIETLKNVAVVGMAEAAYLEYRNIDLIIKYFFDMLKKNRQIEDNNAVINFYSQIIDFFVSKKYYNHAVELIDNYYSEIDKNYNYDEFLKKRIEINLSNGNVDTGSIIRLISKDRDFIDDFLIKNEIFDNQELVNHRLFTRLEKTSDFYKQFKSKKTVAEKYEFFIENDLFKKIRDSHMEFISQWNQSAEVYIKCKNALYKTESWGELENLLLLSKNRLNSNIAGVEEYSKVLNFALKNHSYLRVLNTFEAFMPFDEKIWNELDFSAYSESLFIDLFKFDSNSEFLINKVLENYLNTGNSSGLLSLTKIHPNTFERILNFYIEKKEYELFSFYYQSSPDKIKQQFKEFADRRIRYEDYKKKFNTLILPDYSLINELLSLALSLELYDEAENFVFVRERITGKADIETLEKIKNQSIFSSLKKNIENNPENPFLKEKYNYLADKAGIEVEPYIAESGFDNIVETLEYFASLQEKLSKPADVEKSIEEKEKEIFTEDDFNKEIEAEKFEKAAKIAEYLASDGDYDFYFEAGKIYEGLRKYNESIKNYRLFVLNSFNSEKSPEAQYKIGIMNIALNKINDARISFERLKRYYPDNGVYLPRAQMRLAQIAEEKIDRQFDELQVFKKETKYDEVNRFLDVSDNIEELKAEILKTTLPDRLEILYERLGDIYSEKFENNEEALKNYTQAISYNSDNAKLIEKQAGIYIKLREYEQAIQSYEDFFSKTVDYEQRADIRLKVIEIYFENLRQYNRALDNINYFIDEFTYTDGYYKALHYKAYIYEEYYRDYEKAIEEYSVLAEKYESEYAAKARYSMAYIYEKYLRNYSKAKENYEKVLNDYGDFDLKMKAENALREMRDDGKI